MPWRKILLFFLMDASSVDRVGEIDSEGCEYRNHETLYELSRRRTVWNRGKSINYLLEFHSDDLRFIEGHADYARVLYYVFVGRDFTQNQAACFHAIQRVSRAGLMVDSEDDDAT
ncbi:MAG: hypothetical protein ACJZ7Z_05025 [Myxococcota bacterium]|nr:MAG: hypothetical protein CBC32_003180 [Proteobacteria bacterium TMED72]